MLISDGRSDHVAHGVIKKLYLKWHAYCIQMKKNRFLPNLLFDGMFFILIFDRLGGGGDSILF